MVNKEKQALLELKEILLRMSYDVNKTLSENTIITEQMTPKGPYYTPAGELTDKPGKFISPTTTTNIAASRVYPEITDGKYPKNADFGKLNLAFSGRKLGEIIKQNPQLKQRPKSSSSTPTDIRSYPGNYIAPVDALYVSPQYSGAYEKLPEMGPDLTYTSKREPFPPKAITQISAPGRSTPLEYYLPYPSKRWKGGTTTNKKKLQEIYEQDRKEWGCKYGHDLEDWICRNSDTIHKALQYVSIALTVVALTAATVMSGGAASPALVAYASGLGLALDLVDASLYVYEGNPREAALTFALGAVDAVQLFKGVSDIRKLGGSAADVESLQKKMLSNQSATIEELNKAGKLTKGELAVAEALSSGRNAGKIGKLANTNLAKLALQGAKEYALKSPKHFITSLIGIIRSPITKGLPLAGNVLKLGLVLDGINMSYNFLYNVFSGEDKELQSIVLSILDAFWSEAEPQVEKGLSNTLSGVDDMEISLEIVNADAFTPESIKQELDSLKRVRLSKEKARQTASALSNKYIKKNLPSTGFKTQEEGNKFRKWFNEKFKVNSRLLELDPSGPFDNNYIRSAYWTEIKPGLTVGDMYSKEKTTPKDTEDGMM